LQGNFHEIRLTDSRVAYLAIDQEELARALLERNEAEVLQILGRGDARKHLSARGKVGETPLHVATSWPRGLELLLHLGGDAISDMIDAEDDNGSTALGYALKINEPECVKMLLDASDEMDLESIQNIAKWEQGREKWAVIPILTDALAQRRRDLRCFARESIPQRPDLKSPDTSNEALLQEDAFELVQTLLAAGIDVPKKFRSVRPGSVYHNAHMHPELAQSLFTSGFEHTAVNFLGFTPLMTVDLVALSRRHEAANLLGYDAGALDLVGWFLSHGEDLSTPIPTSAVSTREVSEILPPEPGQQHRLVHRVASELGRCLRWPLALSGGRCSGTALLPEILTSSAAADTCSCACTRDGCSAASVFARELWGSIRGGGDDHDASHGRPALSQPSVRVIMDLLTRQLSGHPGARRFASGFIRVSTFERLGMSHTCCRFINHSPEFEDAEDCVTLKILEGEYKMVEIMDPEDVAEIQEEERYLGALLEGLVGEFEVKYDTLGLPLSEFFLTYWWIRMDEVDAGGKVSGDELEALERAGVVLEA
jgi:hypothetical protein